MHVQRILDFLAEEPLRFFALATVVAVDGSAYRRPGARLLIANQGASDGVLNPPESAENVRRFLH